MAKKIKKKNVSAKVYKLAKIPSLIKLASLKASEHLNTNYALPTDDLVSNILSLPVDTLAHLFPFLHFRWLEAITKKMTSIRESAAPFFTASMRQEEDFQRSKKLLAGQIQLINIYDKIDDFKLVDFPQNRLCLDNASPMITEDRGAITPELRHGDFEWPDVEAGDPSVVSKDQFLRQFEIFTKGQLKGIDWNNVFVAGGCVSACVLPIPYDYDIEKFYNQIAYETSDIDIFLYGLDAEQAKKKVVEIISTIKNSHPDVPLAFFKSSQTITVIREYPYRCTQIVISNFQHKAEVLANFDVDSVCIGYDGTDVLCLPRCKEALNTRVNIINPSLERISYRRITKFQSRGFAFGMPDFLPVPFGGREKSLDKLGLLLSSAIMNLLHNYDIIFDDSNKLSEWESEYNCGVTAENNPRSLDKDLAELYSSDVCVIKSDKKNMEWDSSCGIYGISYYQGVSLNDLSKRACGKTYTSLCDIEDMWGKDDFTSPWTWEGAPEFKDWSYQAQATEIAKLEFTPTITSFSVVIPQSYKEKENYFCIISQPDSQGFVYTIRFDVGEDEYSEGFLISIELGELPVGHDQADPLCSIVAMIVLKGTIKLHLDLAYNFTSENQKTPPICAWFHPLVGADTKKLDVDVEIRSLKQTIPLQ